MGGLRRTEEGIVKPVSCQGCGAQVEARRCEYCTRLHPDAEIKMPLPTRRQIQQTCCGQPMEWVADALVYWNGQTKSYARRSS
jgi:hypothetical protein